MTVADGVQVRFLLVGGQPLLVASCPTAGRGPHLHAALAARGLRPLPHFIGADLPRGARVGFTVTPAELRLEDDAGLTLLRTPRETIDADWFAAARRLRGTMTVVTLGEDLDPGAPMPALADVLDASARDGRLLGAIVGVAEERLTLPLVWADVPVVERVRLIASTVTDGWTDWVPGTLWLHDHRHAAAAHSGRSQGQAAVAGTRTR